MSDWKPLILLIALSAVGCWNAGDSGDDTESDSDTDADSDADTDADTDSDSDSDTSSDTDSGSDIGDTDSHTDPDVQECMDEFNAWPCPCHGDCEDGTGYILYYPDNVTITDPGFWSPSVQEYEVGVALFMCSSCTPCGESYTIKINDTWTTTDILGLCEKVVAENGACGGCLTTNK